MIAVLSSLFVAAAGGSAHIFRAGRASVRGSKTNARSASRLQRRPLVEPDVRNAVRAPHESPLSCVLRTRAAPVASRRARVRVAAMSEAQVAARSNARQARANSDSLFPSSRKTRAFRER